MNLVVTCEYRFYSTPDGQIWTSSAFKYPFWLRYLAVFEKVTVVARVQNILKAEPSWQLSSGDRVCFKPLPYYVGFSGLIKNAIKIRQVIHQAASGDTGGDIGGDIGGDTGESALILRVPSQSAMLFLFGRVKRYGYALEVVGDPYDVFSSGITHKWLDKCLRWLSYRSLQKMTYHALAACYVTKNYLQQRYPVKAGALTENCSSIELKASDIAQQPRTYTQNATKLVFVGSLEQLYKGPDVFIKAIARLQKTGIQLEVNLLGGGRYLSDMKALAKTLKCDNCIHFVGEVAHAQVNAYLDASEVFIMPSLTEGLPRALIEAMARGLPCIASKVGGIPELLNEDYLINRGDDEALAALIARLTQSPTELTQASIQNIATAKAYQVDILENRRRQFYQSYLQLKQTFNESRSSS